MNPLKQALTELLADYLTLAWDSRPSALQYPQSMIDAYDRDIMAKAQKYEAIIKGVKDAD